MALDNVLRDRIIQAAIASRSGDAVDVSLQLWRLLLSHLVSIIGERGFNSLFGRSMNLSRADFPWLLAGDATDSANTRLEHLKTSLQGRSDSDVSRANRTLMLTFTNLLASLIGEPLTNRILSSAWGLQSSAQASSGKEASNE